MLTQTATKLAPVPAPVRRVCSSQQAERLLLDLRAAYQSLKTSDQQEVKYAFWAAAHGAQA